MERIGLASSVDSNSDARRRSIRADAQRPYELGQCGSGDAQTGDARSPGQLSTR